MGYSKRPGEYFDPCQEAAAKSLKCLHRNADNKELCNDYFQYVFTIKTSFHQPFCRQLRICLQEMLEEQSSLGVAMD